MTLAQRVRDYRYAKGWGPDELATRAAISRTALYQIESGRTEQPRAGTLRRIAEALSVSTESLLGQAGGLGTIEVPWNSDPARFALYRNDPESRGDALESPRMAAFASANPVTSEWLMSSREQDIERKFTELLRSPLGESLARIVEESHRLLPRRQDIAR